MKPYLPPESSQFKVLLTTREELGRPVEHLAIDKLQPEAALDLLTSLVGVQRIQQESEIAEQLCGQLLDYLPLGLELVGRYLERDQDLSLKAMLSLLEKKRLRHKSVIEADSTMTAKLGVADAFELSWERLDENAQFLGCLLSLFASADIPWDLVKQAYTNMILPKDGEIDLDILEEARADLVRFNLLQRTGEKTYQLHQLIREFLRDKREQSAQENDLKQAFVAAIVAAAEQIPDSPTRQQIQEVAPAMPHVAEVAKDKNLRNLLSDEELGWPFLGLGSFYRGQGLYDQAAPWFEQCLSINQARFNSNHPAVAASLNNLALIYFSQGRYSQAEPLLVQALELNKRLLGDDSPEVATSLNNLAELYRHQGRYRKAEPSYLQALEMRKRLLGADHPNVARSLINLASLYYFQSRYSEAEPLLLQALELQKRLLGEEHPDLAISLNSLGRLYDAQDRYSEAELLFVQALELQKRLLGKEHPKVAQSLNNLGNLYKSQRRYSEAKPILMQALKLRKRLLGEDHPDVAQSLQSLAVFYYAQGCFSRAEPLYVQSLALQKRLMGEDHPDVAIGVHNLALLYHSQGRYSEAEPLFEQTLEIRKRLLGKDHPDVANSLYNLAHIYFSQGRYSEAEPLLRQALEFYQRRLEPNHPHTVECRKGLAIIHNILNSQLGNLSVFEKKAKKGNSKKKPKGFG